ncbi:hypothetical protein FHS74_002261 [Nitrospirillum iridis]|uniref:Uncharacterized protein n=1 Tax=Nitrospirillum iridis TaxID=765888 RepID=A0A7X0AZ65_9PROT|nr:hypothetical protein [Nitrospirillum iridis]
MIDIDMNSLAIDEPTLLDAIVVREKGFLGSVKARYGQ